MSNPSNESQETPESVEIYSVDDGTWQFGEPVELDGESGWFYRGHFGENRMLLDKPKCFPPIIVPITSVKRK
jgi:hypothetical protein